MKIAYMLYKLFINWFDNWKVHQRIMNVEYSMQNAFNKILQSLISISIYRCHNRHISFPFFICLNQFIHFPSVLTDLTHGLIEHFHSTFTIQTYLFIIWYTWLIWSSCYTDFCVSFLFLFSFLSSYFFLCVLNFQMKTTVCRVHQKLCRCVIKSCAYKLNSQTIIFQSLTKNWKHIHIQNINIFDLVPCVQCLVDSFP